MTDAQRIEALRAENRQLRKIIQRQLFGPAFGRMNRIRANLIEKEIAGTITPREQKRLDQLQTELTNRTNIVYQDWDHLCAIEEEFSQTLQQIIENLQAELKATKKELRKAKRKVT